MGTGKVKPVPIRRMQRKDRHVNHCGSTSVDRNVEDHVVFFWIHRVENQIRSILEDLNRRM